MNLCFKSSFAEGRCVRVGVYEQVHVRVSVCVSESTKDVNFKKSLCAHKDKVRGKYKAYT